MNDKELIALAALAMGVDMAQGFEMFVLDSADPSRERGWNPLDNDGDALRLGVELGFNVYHAAGSVFVEDLDEGVEVQQEYGGHRLAATRRAITRAAAEIGKQLKEKNHA